VFHFYARGLSCALPYSIYNRNNNNIYDFSHLKKHLFITTFIILKVLLLCKYEMEKKKVLDTKSSASYKKVKNQ